MQRSKRRRTERYSENPSSHGETKHIIIKLVRSTRTKQNWTPGRELKFTNSNVNSRIEITDRAPTVLVSLQPIKAVTQTHVTYKRVTGSTCCRSIQVSSVQFMRCKQTFSLLYDSVSGTGVDLFEVWTRNYWIIVITNWMTSQLVANK